MPENRRLITEEELNKKNISLYASLSEKNQEIKKLESKVDSLESVLDTTQRILYIKDLEIDELRSEIRLMKQEDSAQLRYLQDMMIQQSIVVDSLFSEFVEQQDFKLFLTDLRDLPEDEQSALFLQKQMGTLKANVDSLRHQLRTVVQQQNFLREDLTIVESSIMDIIKFSSDKYLQEIEKRHEYVMKAQEMLAHRQDSLLTVYNGLIKDLTEFAFLLEEDREIFQDSVDVALNMYSQRLDSLQNSLLKCMENQTLYQAQLKAFQDSLDSFMTFFQESSPLDTILVQPFPDDSLRHHEN
ncbi:MAG: hypothetical protein PHS99_03820 [Candidatus Marinimicrobia bacterium]|nr:hypothetical protein [Candidatus Neomarinimicrobiota bacterium]